MDEQRPEIDPAAELERLIEIYREHWAPRACQIFEQAATSGRLTVYARKLSADPTDLQINLIVPVLDPITGVVNEVKIGELCPPVIYTPLKAEDAQPFTVPASASVN